MQTPDPDQTGSGSEEAARATVVGSAQGVTTPSLDEGRQAGAATRVSPEARDTMVQRASPASMEVAPRGTPSNPDNQEGKLALILTAMTNMSLMVTQSAEKISVLAARMALFEDKIPAKPKNNRLFVDTSEIVPYILTGKGTQDPIIPMVSPMVVMPVTTRQAIGATVQTTQMVAQNYETESEDDERTRHGFPVNVIAGESLGRVTPEPPTNEPIDTEAPDPYSRLVPLVAKLLSPVLSSELCGLILR